MHATQNKKLIYDIGFHKGEDLGYYLHLGYKVVGVDADPKMVENLKQIYSNEFNSGQLIILNHAISDKDNEEVEFNISEWSFWNSLRKEVASRDNKQVNSIYVITKRLDSIMHQFGIPYYCKIDIEGLDALAVNTLNNLEHKPTFISVETECLGADELISDEEALITLNALREAGYNRFKLVDQRTLEVLDMKKFYGVAKIKPSTLKTLVYRLMGRKDELHLSYFEKLKKKFKYNFPSSSTGPFGNQLGGKWFDYDDAKKLLLFHRKMNFERKDATNYSFWCDWHATKF